MIPIIVIMFVYGNKSPSQPVTITSATRSKRQAIQSRSRQKVALIKELSKTEIVGVL